MFLIIHFYEAVFSCFQSLYPRLSVEELFYQHSVLCYRINLNSDIEIIQLKSKASAMVVRLGRKWQSKGLYSPYGRRLKIHLELQSTRLQCKGC